MTTHEIVNRRYAELQSLLVATFAAEGRGIIEMLRNVEDQLSPKLAWELRSIGHIRNQVVHEGLKDVPKYFEPLCKEATAALKLLKSNKAAKLKALKESTKANKPAIAKVAKAAKPRSKQSVKGAAAKRKPTRAQSLRLKSAQ